MLCSIFGVRAYAVGEGEACAAPKMLIHAG
jgi:hypothetical protein